MFGIEKVDLKDLLKSARAGQLQLPDFQRDYVWTDNDVRSLIASVAKGFPVGALLTLQTGGEVDFKPRVLEGVPDDQAKPDELLLDGQQRMTSLYQSAFSDAAVRTRNSRGTEVDRFYYINIRRALSAGADIEECIVGVPKDKILRTNFGKDIELDVSRQELEFDLHMFPLNRVFFSKYWMNTYLSHWKEKGEDQLEMYLAFDDQIIERISRYEMPVIRLDRKNTREAICLVFEKVNVGGKKLDAFELLTAIFAADKYDLREDWNGPSDKSKPGRRERIIGSPNKRDVLTNVASTDFLQSCTLLHTRDLRVAKAEEGLEGKELPQVSCRRDSLLGLPLPGYQKHANAVEAGFIEAGNFLNEHKIIWHKDVPYPPLIVGLSAAFTILGKEAQNASAKAKIARWFWSVTLGELFGSSTESRLARDVPELVDWIRDSGGEPQALNEAVFQQERLQSLRMRRSAAYKGIHALLMQNGCRDFVSGRPTDIMTFFNDRIDIHHVFPQKWCKDQGIEPGTFNSIINKTPLSYASNREIGGVAPSTYLKRIEERHGITSDQLDAILRSHLIEPEHLRNDDFDSFFQTRRDALSEIIGSAMGKSVVLEPGHDEEEREVDLDGDDEETA